MKPLKRSPFIAVLVLIFAFGSMSVFAKDVWLNVKSQNFNLYGNASEKEIKKAATKLEQFRETFGRVFTSMNMQSSVPTNVIVFKSNSYYKAFKPRRADGEIDDFIAGLFVSGEDVNYITLSMDGNDEQIFGLIFHEYVHSILNNNFPRSMIPSWFNEGLAEYYHTFKIEGNREVSLGLPLPSHLQLLHRNKMTSLADLFAVSSYQVLQMKDDERSVFYAQSWALVHYLIQGGKGKGLGKFLDALGKGVEREKAFTDAFQMNYEQMEKELRKYINRASYNYNKVKFEDELTFDTKMIVKPVDEGEANAYLGDLLFHMNRVEDSEPYLAKALAIHPDSLVANMTMGMVRLREEKFDEARQYLDKAVSENSNNQFACYRYAYVLLRSGTVSKETAEKSIALLKRSIELDPKFLPNYSLMAFAALSSGIGMDDAVAAVSSALKFKPNDASLMLDLASLYMRSDRIDDAGKLAERAATLTDDPGLKNRAQSINSFVAMTRQGGRNGGIGGTTFVGPVGGLSTMPELSEEERDKAAADFKLQNINNDLGPVGEGLERVVGKIEKIACPDGNVRYSVRSGGELFTLSSTDFQGLELMIYGGHAGGSVGCDADLSADTVVLTYKPSAGKDPKIRGELLAIGFVPDDFRLMSEDELAAVNDKAAREKAAAEAAEIAANLERFPSTRNLQPGEKRGLGILETMECGNGMPVFRFKTAGQTLRLSLSPGTPFGIVSKMDLTSYPSPACGMDPWKNKVVFVYKGAPDKKLRTDGTLSVIELVADDFEFTAPQ